MNEINRLYKASDKGRQARRQTGGLVIGIEANITHDISLTDLTSSKGERCLSIMID